MKSVGELKPEPSTTCWTLRYRGRGILTVTLLSRTGGWRPGTGGAAGAGPRAGGPSSTPIALPTYSPRSVREESSAAPRPNSLQRKDLFRQLGAVGRTGSTPGPSASVTLALTSGKPMKPTLSAALLTLLAFVLPACGGSSDPHSLTEEGRKALSSGSY